MRTVQRVLFQCRRIRSVGIRLFLLLSLSLCLLSSFSTLRPLSHFLLLRSLIVRTRPSVRVLCVCVFAIRILHYIPPSPVVACIIISAAVCYHLFIFYMYICIVINDKKKKKDAIRETSTIFIGLPHVPRIHLILYTCTSHTGRATISELGITGVGENPMYGLCARVCIQLTSVPHVRVCII